MHRHLSNRGARYAVIITILLSILPLYSLEFSGYAKIGKEFRSPEDIIARRMQFFGYGKNFIVHFFGCGSAYSHMGISFALNPGNFYSEYIIEKPQKRPTWIQNHQFKKLIHQEMYLKYQRKHLFISNYYKLNLMNSEEFEETQTEADDNLTIAIPIILDNIHIIPKFTYHAGLNKSKKQDYYIGSVEFRYYSGRNLICLQNNIYSLHDRTFNFAKLTAAGEFPIKNDKYIRTELFAAGSQNIYLSLSAKPRLYFGRNSTNFADIGAGIITQNGKAEPLIAADLSIKFKRITLISSAKLSENHSLINSIAQLSVIGRLSVVINHIYHYNYHQIFVGAGIF